MTLIAVYGTLRKGMTNHNLLKNAYHLSNGMIQDHKLFLKNRAPCVTPEPNMAVICEVYDIIPSEYEQIKQMELKAGYKENEVNVLTTNFKTIRAKCFTQNTGKSYTPIPQGCYTTHVMKKLKGE